MTLPRLVSSSQPLPWPSCSMPSLGGGEGESPAVGPDPRGQADGPKTADSALTRNPDWLASLRFQTMPPLHVLFPWRPILPSDLIHINLAFEDSPAGTLTVTHLLHPSLPIVPYGHTCPAPWTGLCSFCIPPHYVTGIKLSGPSPRPFAGLGRRSL